jgi:hypothetical protein
MTPIFFAITRSFWATVAGIALVVFGAPPEVLAGIGQAWSWIASLWGGMVDPVVAGEQVQRIAPLALWVFALQQRAGKARPYTIRPTAETLK